MREEQFQSRKQRKKVEKESRKARAECHTGGKNKLHEIISNAEKKHVKKQK